MSESKFSRQERELYAAREKIKRLEFALSDQANARELIYQVELLQTIQTMIARIDVAEISPAAQRVGKGEKDNARKSLRVLQELARQRLGGINEPTVKELEEFEY